MPPRKPNTTPDLETRKSLSNVLREIRAFDGMTVGELQEQHRLIVGEPTTSKHRRALIKKLSFALQAKEQGGLSERAAKTVDQLGDTLPITWRLRAAGYDPQRMDVDDLRKLLARDPRLPPPGETIKRVYRGKLHTAVVNESSFTYDGQEYPTITEVANAITGNSHWNGYRFFKLNKPYQIDTDANNETK